MAEGVVEKLEEISRKLEDLSQTKKKVDELKLKDKIQAKKDELVKTRKQAKEIEKQLEELTRETEKVINEVENQLGMTGRSFQLISSSLAKEQELPEKTFKDPIYHNIKLHKLLVAIINTPEFHRLRDIKQLGGAYYVYPGASNNRFEHSIGTAYLAGKLVEELKTHYGDLISVEDVLCVKVAGLCHDLGHGPFSHAFEDFFLKKFLEKEEMDDASHEEISCKIVAQIHQNIPEFKEYGLGEKHHLEIIQSLIRGKPIAVLKGKEFLYEIVANKFNEIDVDKWDYFTRDSHGLGIQHGFDLWRLLETARVVRCTNDGLLHIAYRDKVATDLVELFHTRIMVHKRACQHKIIKAAEMMIGDALLLVTPSYKPEMALDGQAVTNSGNEHVTNTGNTGNEHGDEPINNTGDKPGDELKDDKFLIQYYDSENNEIKSCTLSEALKPVKLDAYVMLNDNVMEQIRLKSKAAKPGKSRLFQAGDLLERLVKRKHIYKVIFETKTQEKDTDGKVHQLEEWVEKKKYYLQLGIHAIKYKDKLNPKNVLVYDKDSDVKSLEEMQIQERPFEGCIRVYYKGKGNEEVERKLCAEMETEFDWLKNCSV